MEVEIGFGGAERRREKGRKGEKKREGGRRRNGAEIYGVLRRPWLLLSPFHTLVFKILAQWSFFDELAPVVAIIRSVMVLKLKQPCKVPSIEMDKKVDLFN